MAITIALQKHGFWEQFDPVPTEVIKVELVPYDEKWWRAFRTALLLMEMVPFWCALTRVFVLFLHPVCDIYMI